MEISRRNALVYCHWNVQITHCEDSQYFVILAACTAIGGVILFVLGAFTLYRRYTKNKLASGLTYIDAYLIVTSIGSGLGRAINSLVLITDASPNFMWRQFSSDVSYIPTVLGAFIYLCSLISIVPMESKVYIPPRILKIVRFAFPVVVTLVILALSLPAGYSRDIGNHDRERLLVQAVYLAYTIAAAMLCVGLVVYSRELIRTLDDAYTTVKKDLMSTVGGVTTGFGTINDQSAEFKKVYGERDSMMQKAIFKMKIFYVTYAIICAWFVIILTMFSFKYELMFATLWWSKLQAFGTNMGVILIVLVGMISLAWGESVRIQQKGLPHKTVVASGKNTTAYPLLK
ncbi:hypothetical protein DFS34DRAFT_278143 [Phlyctochytrium arcticum]|nr:hypothetical protein DFS34DRAFT_278143 [Phlyctochytrium arcticum]